MAARACVIVSVLVAASAAVVASPAPPLEWLRQFGGPAADRANSVATDGVITYVVGTTSSVLISADGIPQVNAGGRDAYVRKYDVAGNEMWTREFGTSATDTGNSVAMNDIGDVYVVGSARAPFLGQSISGAYVRKYDSAGNEVWTRQFGVPPVDFGTSAFAISCDRVSGNVYVSGGFSGPPFRAFVRKYDAAGNELWTREFATTDGNGPGARTIAADPISGGVYVGGFLSGTLPGQVQIGSNDGFLKKYDAGGNELWTRQFGTSTYTYADDVSANPAGDVYIGGYVAAGDAFPGQVASGGEDAFIRKYDADGNEVWTRQFGTSSDDAVLGVSADSSSRGVYVAGNTFGGSFPGFVNAGDGDAFARAYDEGGNELWTQQVGSPALDHGWAISSRGASVFVAGDTAAAMPGQVSAGNIDAFIVKISVAAPDTTPPVIAVASDITAEATSALGAIVHYDASATDDIDGNVAVSCDPPSGAMFALGTTEVTCSATDTTDNMATATFAVHVVDTVAPNVTSVSATPSLIWAPNKAMVSVSVLVDATDAVSDPQSHVVSVTGNDGATARDAEITGALTVAVRADRKGGGTGRTYSIMVETQDAAGNATESIAKVFVPHDQRKR